MSERRNTTFRLLWAASHWLLEGQDTTADERRAVMFLIGTCAIAATISMVTLVFGMPASPLPLVLFIVALFTFPLLLRAGLRPHVVHGLALVALAGFLTAMCFMDDTLYMQQLYWFSMLPLSGGLLLRRRGLLMGAALALLGAAIALLLHVPNPPSTRPLAVVITSTTIDVVSFLAGITALTSIYVALHQSAVRRAEAAARARSEFLAQMSHELRTPMNGVLGMLQLYDENAEPEARREQLALMRRSGEAMVAIIDDLLDFSRLEAQQLQIASAPFDPRTLVRDAVALYGPQATDKGLLLQVDVAHGLPAHLAGDALRIGQVLRNLVSNAVKFTERGSVHVALSWQDDVLTGTITDDGIGIPAEALPTLFEPFRQAHAATTTCFGGSGLGLAISRNLCQRMSGDITVSSRPGSGSRFTFTCRAPSASGVPAASAPVTGEFVLLGRVLVVDDNEINRLVAQRICERAGLAVSLANDGEMALAALQQDSFDLVLMDCQMPTMDSFEATRRIRSLDGPMSRLPVVAVTASTLPDEIQRCRDVGMNDVVAKPLSARTLLAVIGRHVGRGDAGGG